MADLGFGQGHIFSVIIWVLDLDQLRELRLLLFAVHQLQIVYVDNRLQSKMPLREFGSKLIKDHFQDIFLATVELFAIIFQFLHQIIDEPGEDTALEVCDLFRYLQGLETHLVACGAGVHESGDEFDAPYVFVSDLVLSFARSSMNLTFSE